MEDVAADGVVYLETRFGPLSHQRSGLGGDEVMAAVIAGLAEGEAATGTVAHRAYCDVCPTAYRAMPIAGAATP